MKFFKLDAGHERIFGLDLLRFFAISYVVLGHSKILIPEAYDHYIGKIIIDGVSIFFVLSGFLIGRILIKQLIQGKGSFRDLISFWSKRWMRTLPAYFLILAFLVAYTYALKPNRLPDDWYKYFLFIQNFGVPQPPFFSESWSLSIEEWFYILVPILFFTLLFLFKKYFKIVLILAILGGISGVAAYRYYLYFHVDVSNFSAVDLNIMRQVIPRLDAIMLGVLGAYLSIYLPQLWKFAARWWIFVGMFLVLYLLKQYNSSFTSMYYCVLIPLFKATAVFFMLPFLSGFKLKKANLFTKFITLISVTSYSMYLINRTIMIDIVIKYGLNDNLKKKHVFSEGWIYEYVFFWIITIIGSFLMYKLVERPFLKLRDRILARS